MSSRHAPFLYVKTWNYPTNIMEGSMDISCGKENKKRACLSTCSLYCCNYLIYKLGFIFVHSATGGTMPSSTISSRILQRCS